ncbi:MAG: glycosyltransferase [Marinagarivorans sp.]
MSRIVCVWELGDDLGHFSNFSPLIEEMLQANHEVFFLVKDLANSECFSWSEKIRFFQAPIFLSKIDSIQEVDCFANILQNKGYQSVTTLAPLVKAWMALFSLLKPDLIIFDHAPTALLASNNLSLPRITLSNGFLTPPAGTAPQNLQPWLVADQSRIEHSEAHVVQVINKVASSLGLQNIARVSDLYSAHLTCITGFKAIDFYRSTRTNALYLSPASKPNSHPKPNWQPNNGKKVFAYLKSHCKTTPILLDALALLNVNLVCYCAGAKDAAYNKYQGSSVQISSTLFDINAALAEADIVMCHAGPGMVNAALLAGCPMVLIPMQLEQANTSRILEAMGVAISLKRSDDANAITKKLSSFFNNPSYAEQSRLFRRRQSEFSDLIDAQQVWQLCEALL